jgi:hypothetical protein
MVCSLVAIGVMLGVDHDHISVVKNVEHHQRFEKVSVRRQ